MRIKEILEGKSPHPKGSKKYKAHMAAMHASAEPKGKMIKEVVLDEAKRDAGYPDDSVKIGKKHYIIYKDRRDWYGFEVDKEGNQVADAIFDPRKGELKKILLRFQEEVELDEAKNYEIKNGKIHISKANFRKVHKDYKNSTKGKERMIALDPKSGATTSYEVVFEEGKRPHKIIEGETFQLDEAQYYIWQIDGNSALVSAVGPDGQPAPKDQARRINIGQKVLDMSSGMPTLRDKIQMVAIDNQLTGQMVDIQGRVR